MGDRRLRADARGDVLIFGSLGDRLGRRRIFAFGSRDRSALASLACGLASDPLAPRSPARRPGPRRRGDVRDLARADRGRVRGPRARHGARPSGARRPAAAVAIGPLIGGALIDGFGVGVRSSSSTSRSGLLRRCSSPAAVPESRDPRRDRSLDVAGSSPAPARCRCSSSRCSAATRRAGGAPLILGLVRGRRDPARRLRRDRAPRRAAAARPRACFASRATAGVSLGDPRSSRSRSSRCSSTSSSTSRTCSATSAFETGLRLFPLTVALVLRRRRRRPARRRGSRLRLPVASGLGPRRRRAAADRARSSPDSDWTALLAGRHRRSAPAIGMVNPAIAAAALGVAPVRRAAWRPASTTPSACWASPSASRRSARSVEHRDRDSARRASLPAAPPSSRRRRRHREPRAAAAARGRAEPGRGGRRDAFIGWLNEIFLIAAIVALRRRRAGARARPPAATSPRASERPARGRASTGGANPSAAAARTGAMLLELRIENLLLIERAELRLGEG